MAHLGGTSALALAALAALQAGCHEDDTGASPLPDPTVPGWEPLRRCDLVDAPPQIVAAPLARAPAAVDGDLLVAGPHILQKTLLGWKLEAEIVLPETGCCRDVAISGETAAVIGLPEGPWSGGPVYVVERAAGSWRVVELSPSYFSRSVAISGTTVAVGCHGADAELGCQEPHGTVGIYERLAGTWTQTAQLVGEGAACLFGDSLALSGDTLVVGEGTRAHVFVRRDGAWLREGVLEATEIGGAIALHGDVAVLGRARRQVFHRRGEAWELLTELASAATTPGEALALHDGCIGAGAPSGDGPGSVEIFEPSRHGWRHEVVVASEGGEVDGFGMSVSLSEGWLAVGGLEAVWVYDRK